MTETIRYSQIGQEDLNLGLGNFEVELADGRHVVLSQIDVGRILANPAVSSPFILQAYQRLALPSVPDAGVLARATDEVGGIWMSGGDLPWMAINGEVANVKDPVFGARGDGITDDTDAINLALGTGKVVFLPPGTYVISNTLVMTLSGTTLRGSGIGLTTIYCAGGTNFQDGIRASQLTGIAVRDLTLDLNKDGRSGALTTTMRGIHFDDCLDSSVINCLVKNGLGGITPTGIAPGFGIAIRGANTRRSLIQGCIARDCGVTGKEADGIYVNGQQNLIIGCFALSCVGHGFVLENCDQSGISGCTARSCSAGAAITAATTGSYTGNYISGLTIYDWNASVGGGLELGTVSGTANLDGTIVAGVTMQRVAGSGPAINVKQEGGLTTNLSIVNSHILGSGFGESGIKIRGSKIAVTGCQISGVGASCILVQIQSSDVTIANNYCRSTVAADMISFQDCNDAVVMNNVLRGDGITSGNGIIFHGTAVRCHAMMNVVYGVTGAAVSSEVGTLPLAINPSGSGFGGANLGTDPGNHQYPSVTSNLSAQLGLNEFSPMRDIKWGVPLWQFPTDPSAPPYVVAGQTGWLRVVESGGGLRLVPVVNPS